MQDIRRETELKIRFKKGYEIEVTIVSDDMFITSKVFSNKTHNFAEMLDFIDGHEMGGYEAYT